MRYILIPSHHIFFSCPPFYVPLFSPLSGVTVKNQWPGHLSEPLREKGGATSRIWAHLCLSSYLPALMGLRAEGPMHGPPELCNQHCQARLPMEHTGLTIRTVCVVTLRRLAVRLAGCCCGPCQTTASLSQDSAQLDEPGALRCTRLNRCTAKSWEAATRHVGKEGASQSAQCLPAGVVEVFYTQPFVLLSSVAYSMCMKCIFRDFNCILSFFLWSDTSHMGCDFLGPTDNVGCI